MSDGIPKQNYKVIATHKCRGTKVQYKDGWAHHGFDDGGAHDDAPDGSKYYIEPVHKDTTPPAKRTGLGIGLLKALKGDSD